MTSQSHPRQPLAGRLILVTRARHQASELADGLRRLGATVLLIPTIEITQPSSYQPLDEALRQLSSFDCIAFTSANAVEAFRARADALGISPLLRRVAAVGRATERALHAAGLQADVVPPVFTAESLAMTLAPQARDSRFLLVLAEDAPTTLADGLMSAGAAQVVLVAAYRNRIPQSSIGELTALFRDPGTYPDGVTFTSASTANNLAVLLQSAQLNLPEKVVRASIGPITSRALRDLNLPPHVEARESTIPALLECLSAYFRAG